MSTYKASVGGTGAADSYGNGYVDPEFRNASHGELLGMLFGANPVKVRERLVGLWDHVARLLRHADEDLRKDLETLRVTWQGEAAESFLARLERLPATCRDAADAAGKTAEDLDHAARAIERAKTDRVPVWTWPEGVPMFDDDWFDDDGREIEIPAGFYPGVEPGTYSPEGVREIWHYCTEQERQKMVRVMEDLAVSYADVEASLTDPPAYDGPPRGGVAADGGTAGRLGKALGEHTGTFSAPSGGGYSGGPTASVGGFSGGGVPDGTFTGTPDFSAAYATATPPTVTGPSVGVPPSGSGDIDPAVPGTDAGEGEPGRTTPAGTSLAGTTPAGAGPPPGALPGGSGGGSPSLPGGGGAGGGAPGGGSGTVGRLPGGSGVGTGGGSRGSGGTPRPGPAGRLPGGGAGSPGPGGGSGGTGRAAGGRPVGMAPMGGAGAGGGQDSGRKTWLTEQEDVWSPKEDGVAPAVLGDDPTENPPPPPPRRPDRPRGDDPPGPTRLPRPTD